MASIICEVDCENEYFTKYKFYQLINGKRIWVSTQLINKKPCPYLGYYS